MGYVIPARISSQSNKEPCSLSLYSADIIEAAVAPVAITALGISSIPNAKPTTKKYNR